MSILVIYVQNVKTTTGSAHVGQLVTASKAGDTFELVFRDFVTMPNSKGKRYILHSFSWYFTAIPCTRDQVIDAACGLYQFFPRHREIPHIVSSDRGTHFTGQVYK